MFRNKKASWSVSSKRIPIIHVLIILAVVTLGGGILLRIVHGVNAAGYNSLPKPDENNHYYNNLDWQKWGADPTMIKVGDTYYIYVTTGTTSKNGTAGKITGYKTTNFRDWTEFNVTSQNDTGYDYIAFWAPEIYHYNDKYYIFVTGHICTSVTADIPSCNEGSRNRTLVTSASSPEGPFSSFTVVNSNVTDPIDPNVLFDGDNIYLYSKSSLNKRCMRNDNAAIYVEKLNSDLKTVSGSSTKVLQLDTDEQGNRENCSDDNAWGEPKDAKNYWENRLIEGPTTFKHGDTYYLLYSTGTLREDTYTIGYATSSSPTGPFTRVTKGNAGSNSTAPLLHGQMYSNSVDENDGTKQIYASGHGFVYQESSDEMYIIYQGYSPKEGTTSRTLNMDYIDFDSSGIMYVNGPSIDNQPAPSGVNGVYRLARSSYTVTVDDTASSTLHDYINHNATNSGRAVSKPPLVTATATSGKNLSISLTDAQNIEDVWLWSGNSDLSGTATVVINDKYQVSDTYTLSGGSSKIQLPKNIPGGVKKINITLSGTLSLSEVSLYYNREPIVPVEFNLVFDGNGGTVSSSNIKVNEGDTVDLSQYTAIRVGYIFKGWTTKKDDASTKVSDSYKPTADTTLYALWEEPTPTPDPEPTPTPDPEPTPTPDPEPTPTPDPEPTPTPDPEPTPTPDIPTPTPENPTSTLDPTSGHPTPVTPSSTGATVDNAFAPSTPDTGIFTDEASGGNTNTIIIIAFVITVIHLVLYIFRRGTCHHRVKF